MGKYKIVPTELSHVELIMPTISPEIVGELTALSSSSCEEIIEKNIRSSIDSWSVFYEGQIVCIFGISTVTLLDNTGYPWLITSTRMKQHLKYFLMCTPIVINYWLKQYESLVQYIPDDFTAGIRWLKWAGFTVGKPVCIGYTDIPISEVRLDRKAV